MCPEWVWDVTYRKQCYESVTPSIACVPRSARGCLLKSVLVVLSCTGKAPWQDSSREQNVVKRHNEITYSDTYPRKTLNHTCSISNYTYPIIRLEGCDISNDTIGVCVMSNDTKGVCVMSNGGVCHLQWE